MKKKIALLQMDVAVGDVDRNYYHVEELVETAVKESPDILVLPETWNTGFYPTDHLPQEADKNGERTQTLLSQLAKKHAVNIVGGSVATLRDNKVYNTSYIVNREGTVISQYDKIHSFTPAKEEKFFQGGEQTHRFYLDEIPCSSVTCYDIRFPEIIRTTTLQGVDLFFVPAQWPTMRQRHWEILNTARAIENQMFLCAVNACGYIGKIKCAGNSLLLDPWGDELLHLGDSEEVAIGTIDLSVTDDIRRKINVFRDRKPNMYHLD